MSKSCRDKKVEADEELERSVAKRAKQIQVTCPLVCILVCIVLNSSLEMTYHCTIRCHFELLTIITRMYILCATRFIDQDRLSSSAFHAHDFRPYHHYSEGFRYIEIHRM